MNINPIGGVPSHQPQSSTNDVNYAASLIAADYYVLYQSAGVTEPTPEQDKNWYQAIIGAGKTNSKLQDFINSHPDIMNKLKNGTYLDPTASLFKSVAECANPSTMNPSELHNMAFAWSAASCEDANIDTWIITIPQAENILNSLNQTITYCQLTGNNAPIQVLEKPPSTMQLLSDIVSGKVVPNTDNTGQIQQTVPAAYTALTGNR